jgi:hypothetical protein
MIDISKGGLGFRYVDIGHRPERSFNLTISKNDNGFRLQNVPAKTIWDGKEAKRFPFDINTMRRCGVQFGELRHDQSSDLEYFIQHFTIG